MTFNPLCTYSGGRRNTQLRDLLTLQRQPTARQPPSFSQGGPLGSCSLSMAVLTPSLLHPFSKASGYIARHHLPGGGGGNCNNICSFFKQKIRDGCGKIEMCFFSTLRTALTGIIPPCTNKAHQLPKAQQNLSHLKILPCVASSLRITAVSQLSNNEYCPYLKWAEVNFSQDMGGWVAVYSCSSLILSLIINKVVQ